MRAGVLMPARSMAALRAGSPSTTFGLVGHGPKIWRSSSRVTRSSPVPVAGHRQHRRSAFDRHRARPRRGRARWARADRSWRRRGAGGRRRRGRRRPSRPPRGRHARRPWRSSVTVARQGDALVVEAGDGTVGLLVDADAVAAVAVPVADDRQGVGAAGRAERDRRGLDAHVDQHHERRLGLPVQADRVAAVAVEVAGDRPHVGAGPAGRTAAAAARRPRRQRSENVASVRE